VSAPVPGQLAPIASLLSGFVELYDYAAHPDVIPAVHMTENHVMQDPDLPAALQVFVEDGGATVRVVRVHLEGYFIVPLKVALLNPAHIYRTVRRMVALEPGARRGVRFRFWLAGVLLDWAQRLLTPSGGSP
jgi:hypothetical protein